ncbi:S9 family peptidase [Paenibacillus sp. F411]|uniref:S9 family peptidase n=1 Tax=Paenibacillus sp. F411 TaxID=2820239 RepID=UPI001AAFA1C3|nr:S9 family peptidase [Paenibacillus sp. F411]MBO2944289.1 S9 family peptidase [Paenibacillus sp. F411]
MTTKRMITPEDLYRMKWVSEPAVSPVQDLTAYVYKEVSESREGYTSHIRLISHDGVEERVLTQGEQDSSPAWSPDGSQLAFLRKSGSNRQVFMLPVNGGEAECVTSLKHGASSFQWSPDGTALLVKSQIASGEEDDPAADDQVKLPEAQVFNRIKYKSDGSGLWNNRRSHLVLVSLSGTRETRCITSGDFDVTDYAWAPDGSSVAYVTSVSSEACRDADLSRIDDVFTVQLQDLSTQKMTDSSLSIHSVSFTPDGSQLLLLADDLSCGLATLTRIHLLPLQGGSCTAMYSELDIQIGHSGVSDMRAGAGSKPQFSTDGGTVFVQISHQGSVHVAAYQLDGSGMNVVTTGEREVYEFGVAHDGRLILASADPLHPGDLYVLQNSHSEEISLTNVNNELWSELQLSLPESFTFKTQDEWSLQGWIMKPTHLKEGQKAPAVLEIHGGPQAMYGHTFMLEFQLLAAAGYAVIYSNPRGGHGYGQVHVNTVRGDYGGRDYQDLMELVDYVIEAYDCVDPSRLGVTGGSYGGFMTNWIVGHTDRFQAAVTQRSISNWISFYGVSDIGYFFTEDMIQGNPWQDLSKLWEHSPLAYVQHVNTPLLILHGEQDLRCPIEQGEQLFIALKRLGKTTSLVRFPGADHNLSRSGHPALRVQRLSHIVNWFVTHIKQE